MFELQECLVFDWGGHKSGHDVLEEKASVPRLRRTHNEDAVRQLPQPRPRPDRRRHVFLSRRTGGAGVARAAGGHAGRSLGALAAQPALLTSDGTGARCSSARSPAALLRQKIVSPPGSATKEVPVRVLLRIVAVLLVLIALFLVYAVIAAVTSEGGARVGVAIGYVIGALVLVFAASKLWNAGGGTRTA